MKFIMRDYSELLQNALRDCGTEAEQFIFVGIDESSNRVEIFQLVHELSERGVIRGGSGLWREQWKSPDGTLNYIYGGVASLKWSGMKGFIDEGSNRVKYTSDEDAVILDILVTYFLSYGRVVLLTEDISTNAKGLRRPLQEIFGPLLEKNHQGKLSLVVIFKKGKTSIDEYCARVTEILEKADFEFGYTEILI